MTEDDFLQAIVATPGETALRMAYADWLEERDDQRHELVRVCEAMRRVPVWSDRYWELKARRNALWGGYPIGWLEATGYDGSYYDPVFRDGVPDGWWERWRLVREFTERWHGIAVPDVGGREAEVRREQERLGLELPASAQEYVAYAHDLGIAIPQTYDSPSLFHCADYYVNQLNSRRAVSLIDFSLDSGVLGVANEDLQKPDPPTYFYGPPDEEDSEYDDAGVPVRNPATPVFFEPSLSLSVLRNLFIELPTAGSLETTVANGDEFLARLTADFPVHAKFDDADVYEAREILVLVTGPRSRYGGGLERRVRAVLRRPIPIGSIPAYLFGADDRDTFSSGLLGPAWYRQQQEEAQSRPGARLPPRWMSVLRREEAARSWAEESRYPEVYNPFPAAGSPPVEGQPPPPDLPQLDWDDDIPF